MNSVIVIPIVKKWVLLGVTVLAAWCAWHILSSNTSFYVNTYDDTNIYYRAFINKELAALQMEIDNLHGAAKAYEASDINLKQLQRQVNSTRMAYKRIEGIATYYFPEHINAYINGAPLGHVAPLSISEDAEAINYYMGSAEQYNNSMPLDQLEAGHYSGNTYKVLPPVGLQRIDELVFSDEVTSSTSELVNLTTQLKTTFSVLKEALNYRKYYYDFEVMESSRLQLVRILGRGITGFDTPGSQNAIPETSASLYGLQELLLPLIEKSTLIQQKQITNLFKNAQKFLKKHDDFETFDRLEFIKTYLNPLYKTSFEVQKGLGIVPSAERYSKTPSWNANSKNMFDADFLNPYYYSLLKAKDDSPQLRQLGERLFFDTRLSRDNNISCASCHNPKMAYTDGERTSKSGVTGKRLDRNSPTLINAVFSERYFYDLRAFDLEDQAEHVIASHLEFNTSLGAIVKTLNSDDAYTKAFQEVYKTTAVNRYQFSSALASYVISLVSFNSVFDTYMRGETTQLDEAAKRGFNLFMGKANCGTCHYAPTFSGLTPPLFRENESEVLGVLETPGSFTVDKDLGRTNNGIDKDNQPIYNRSFKTTTVRNAALTAPYFHNGAYDTLEEVIEFYNTGGGAGIGLSYEVPNQTLSADHLNLSTSEIQDVKAFIMSLSASPNNWD